MERQHIPTEVFCFCSDSPDDTRLLEQLECHLSVLRQEGAIFTWNKRKIAAGSDWQMELDRHLNTAPFILLLISSDFLDAYQLELRRAMERHDTKEAHVIPILLRSCDWKNTLFGRLRVVPHNEMPLQLWPNRDEGFTEVAQEIRSILQLPPSSPLSPSTLVPKRPPWNPPHPPQTRKRRRIGSRSWIILALIAMVLIAIGAIFNGDLQGQKMPPSDSISTTQGQATQQSSASAATPTPKPTAKPAPTFAQFGDGTFVVGKDIQPGTYRTRTGSPGCYYERLSGFGNTPDEIIANNNTGTPAIVTIAATDKGFLSDRCGTWTKL